MAFALLKPVLTFILYPHTRTVVDNPITWKGTSYEQTAREDQRTEDMGRIQIDFSIIINFKL